MTGTGSTGSGTEVPQELTELYGKDQYEETSEIPVEHGYIWTSCASVENGNPIFWDDAVAEAITGGPIAPPCMVSVWFRPHHWAPGRSHQLLPLQVHFDLKERLGLPEAVMTDDTIEFHEPVRLGDLLRTHQVLRSVSGTKETKLGEGRFWVIDVVYRNRARRARGGRDLHGLRLQAHVSCSRACSCAWSCRRLVERPRRWRAGDGRRGELVRDRGETAVARRRRQGRSQAPGAQL